MTSVSEEPNLAERFRRGDDTAFDRIVERYAAAVAALANRLLGWPGDVDDVVQDVFLAAFTGLRSFRGDCHLRTWLFTITINTCRRHRYQHRRRRAPAVAPRFDTGAERRAMDHEDFARARRAVAALPAKYREVVVLRYLQEFETRTIGELLGISGNAVEVRLNRARKRLKEELAED